VCYSTQPGTYGMEGTMQCNLQVRLVWYTMQKRTNWNRLLIRPNDIPGRTQDLDSLH